MSRAPQTIQLDCEPFAPRPDQYIDDVIEGTGLPKRKDCSRFFGQWTWDYSDIPAEEWDKIRPILKERIEKLFHAGKIRYGSW